MVFNSLQFALFLPLVFVLYWTLLRKHQNKLLLLASYVFYGSWDWRFLSLIWISTLADYTIARAMARADLNQTDNDPQNPDTRDIEKVRRRLMLSSVAVNLGILGFFKYFNFFADSAATLLNGIGLETSPAFLGVILPVGISFYTFQTLGYTIDVFRRDLEPTDDLLDFAVYVAYFPQLVAGPIERASRLLPQIQARRSVPRRDDIASGIFLILLGLFKKVVIADGIAGSVNEAFARSETGSWIMLLVGLYAFALQIYGDFSGYSSIARGTSRLLGIELMVNFEQPYLSRNITHFWRTWHISLSTWLRDYLYITLGGNRGGVNKTYRNLALTMLLGGLWHGASWNFVIWGGLHGAYLIAHRFMRDRAPKKATDPVVARDILPMLATFHLVCLTWIFFRAESFGQAWSYLSGILTFRSGAPDYRALSLLLPLGLMMLVIDLTQRQIRNQTAVLTWTPVRKGLAFGVMVLGVIVFSGAAEVPFIYFQF
jgi:D-alanyl-lipoteichoic acid acyltransferase DltB (MBOAT superfamily)